MSGPRPVGFSIFPGKFPPGAARDRFYSLNRRVSWLGRVPSLPPVSPPAGHAPIHLGTLSMADVGGRKIKSWKLLTAAGKIPLEASALPHTCLGTAGGRYGNLGCSGVSFWETSSCSQPKDEGRGGAFVGFFGRFWDLLGSVEPAVTLGVWKMEPVPHKAQGSWFFPRLWGVWFGAGDVSTCHRISQNITE